ncbi:hypothetical protein OG481_09890 [Streptomyces longwoodensis]|uniref:hypothetical protein n=1 Tax=Streptomyces longwoodensis TaxID=68231 RepID=UPI002DDA3E5D|nr:hypothetical protein [Streptomyces longwoodensis]WRY88828.1 hypothetical protein OG481_09890 [Streptomyces longwoodensis]
MSARASLADRMAEAASSGGRAAGYCWLEHPDGGRYCTRAPGHSDREHIDVYRGRESVTSVAGTAWRE